MRFEVDGMRTMDLDPTYVPYLEQLIASRSVPTHLEDVAVRRARVAKARRSTVAAPPQHVAIERAVGPSRSGSSGHGLRLQVGSCQPSSTSMAAVGCTAAPSSPTRCRSRIATGQERS